MKWRVGAACLARLACFTSHGASGAPQQHLPHFSRTFGAPYYTAPAGQRSIAFELAASARTWKALQFASQAARAATSLPSRHPRILSPGLLAPLIVIPIALRADPWLKQKEWGSCSCAQLLQTTPVRPSQGSCLLRHVPTNLAVRLKFATKDTSRGFTAPWIVDPTPMECCSCGGKPQLLLAPLAPTAASATVDIGPALPPPALAAVHRISCPSTSHLDTILGPSGTLDCCYTHSFRVLSVGRVSDAATAQAGGGFACLVADADAATECQACCLLHEDHQRERQHLQPQRRRLEPLRRRPCRRRWRTPSTHNRHKDTILGPRGTLDC
eukprot:TRINITY_DN816_c0_g1_i6.p1 TRINITY_DN816_c0_g1~~TRINITY_DN816_c0_g1_i6.p1  ORF type:complete len:327 (+),score=2.16 TRINITY_DN816_c0_g1_i6:264-1244(+)